MMSCHPDDVIDQIYNVTVLLSNMRSSLVNRFGNINDGKIIINTN